MATFQAHEHKNLRKASVTLLKAIRESSWNKFQFVFCQTWMPTIALRHCNSPLRKTRAFFEFLLQLRKKNSLFMYSLYHNWKDAYRIGSTIRAFPSPGLRLHLKGAPLNRNSFAFRTMQIVRRLPSFKFLSDWLFQSYIRVLCSHNVHLLGRIP